MNYKNDRFQSVLLICYAQMLKSKKSLPDINKIMETILNSKLLDSHKHTYDHITSMTTSELLITVTHLRNTINY